MLYNFDKDKNELLKKTRDISFEVIIAYLGTHYLLDIISNPSRQYPLKKMYIVYVKERDYVYSIPFIQENNVIQLRTIFPNRVLNKIYKKEVKYVKTKRF